MVRVLIALSLILVSVPATAAEPTSPAPASAKVLPDARGRWKHGNDILEFTGKSAKKGRFTVEVDYMGMRVSSRGRWMQTKPGLLVWKLTDINLGGAPGDSGMLPSAGDYMFGLFKNEGGKLRLYYEMEGYSSKDAKNHPAASKIADGPLYTAAPKK